MEGAYYDKDTDSMALLSEDDNYRSCVIDGQKKLQDFISSQEEYERERQASVEALGHLSVRCLEGLRLDEKVPRNIFRTLSLAAQEKA